MIALKCRRVSPAAARIRPRGSVGIEAGLVRSQPGPPSFTQVKIGFCVEICPRAIYMPNASSKPTRATTVDVAAQRCDEGVGP
jgi:hypothetical protein